MANSNLDKQMERMQFLMEYKTTPKVDTKAGIEYSINTADGKTYGIIRENNMYYIKTTTPDKANIKESYEYLGGYNYRNEHGYKSYNEATKHLELELMSINESCGKHEDVSITLDPNKGKKDMQTLTEAARTELDRMHQIFENSGKIGHYNNSYGDPESKGKASSENTTKNNAPFEEKAEATLDKDPKFNGTVDGATPDNKDVTVTDSELGSDKMKTGKRGDEEYKDTHDDLDGEGVADKKPQGAKAVKMNESLYAEEDELTPEDFTSPVDVDVNGEEPIEEPVTSDDGLAGFDNGTEPIGDEPMSQAPVDDINPDDFNFDDENNFEDETDLDALLREFADVNVDANVSDNNVDANVPAAPLEENEEAILKGEPSTLAGDAGKGENNVHGEETMDKINEDADNQKPEGAGKKESKLVGPDKVMDGPHGSLDAQTWDKLQESIDRITDAVFEKLSPKKKTPEQVLAEAVDRIVAEEVTKLDAWGKHPRYQKPAFKTPANKEVAPNGSKDWNDDSTKGEQPYGKQIGSSAPFEQKVDMLTDAVVNMIKEQYGLKKK